MRLIALVPLLLSATLTFAPLSAGGAQKPARHALDPLSANEITRTVALLRASGHLTPQSLRHDHRPAPAQERGSHTRSTRHWTRLVAQPGFSRRRRSRSWAGFVMDGRRQRAAHATAHHPPRRGDRSLENDVPANAQFLSSTMHDHLGRPIVVPKAIAIYERDGGILWRHANMSRRARQLVVSGHATIDNYDYQFNWIFGQDGAIESEVVLSGIMNVNNTSRRRDTAHVAGHSQAGHLVAPGINAPNHQHFFSYRLDLDVDGAANTIYEVDTEAPATGAANPKGETFTMTERRLVSEQKAIRDVSFSANRNWRVANTHTTNSLGQFTGYTLVPGAATPLFALPGSAPRRTGGFTEHQLWATPHTPDERYAGGEFQNLGRDWEGLSTYTKADRPLADTDVVLWYTLGITHIPRPEDWPYMPAHRGSFRLVPTSFFARNRRWTCRDDPWGSHATNEHRAHAFRAREPYSLRR